MTRVDQYRELALGWSSVAAAQQALLSAMGLMACTPVLFERARAQMNLALHMAGELDAYANYLEKGTTA